VLKRNPKLVSFYIWPAILALIATTVFPFIYVVYLSLHRYDLRYIATRGVDFVGLANFATAFGDPTFWASVSTTFFYIAGALVLEIVLGVAIGLFLNSLSGAWGWVKSFVLIPMMLTPVAIATTFRLLYNYDFGLIGYVLELMNMSRIVWLGNTWSARFAIILADVWQWTPLLALVSLGALQAVDEDQLDAADIDGAGAITKFVFVVLPNIKAILGVGILIRYMDIAKFFDKIYVLTGGGPGTATETLTYHIYRESFKFFKLGYGAAMSILLLIAIVVVSLLIAKVTKAGEEIT
jgi:multiple sugar transport system permease protein